MTNISHEKTIRLEIFNLDILGTQNSSQIIILLAIWCKSDTCYSVIQISGLRFVLNFG